MSATSGTFSVTDSTPPEVQFDPADGSTLVALDTDIIISFDEEVRLINDSAINNTNVDSLITLKDTNSSGANIVFDATINSDKTIITIDLVRNISSEQTLYVTIGAKVEDCNAISASSSTFTAADKLPPTVSIEAVITASIAVNSDITFTFSEAVRNLDDSALTDDNVGSLMTLKDTDANGTHIPFVATINSAKTIITINPVSNFTSGQTVYAAIGATVEDIADNAIPASSKTFKAEFLAVDLENPFNEKDVVGLINAQREIAKRFIEQSTFAVLNRMEWLRRHREEKNLSNQGVKVIFVDETLTEISHTFNFDNFINQSGDMFGNDWAFWSEGNLTVGEVDQTSLASVQEIQTTGITFGVDKKINENRMVGAALRIGNDNVDIGSAGTFLNTDMYSLSLYGTLPFDNKTFIDGNRNGKQIFGSIVYGGEFTKDEFNIFPYGRLDMGYTILDEYSDSGKISALTYNEMKIETNKSSIGFLIDNTLEIKGTTLKPYGRLEYGKGRSYSSDTIVSYYTAYPNTNYTLKGVEELTDNYRVGIGADIETEGKWSYTTSFERNQAVNSSYAETVNVAGSYLINTNTEFSANLNAGNNSNAQISFQFDTKLKNGWSLYSDYEIQNISSSEFDNTIDVGASVSF